MESLGQALSLCASRDPVSGWNAEQSLPLALQSLHMRSSSNNPCLLHDDVLRQKSQIGSVTGGGNPAELPGVS